MAHIRAFLFYIGISLWTVTLAIIWFPACFILPPRKLNRVSGMWAGGCLWLLKVICGIRHEIVGKEYMPTQPSIIACKHQSAWETMIFHIILKNCSYVLKKELKYIPFFGFYLSRIGMVAIDRKGKASALKQMVYDVKKCLEDKRDIIIFPEGTRTAVGGKGQYQAGVAALYSNKLLQAYPVVPVALNSGLFWSKNAFTKSPGTITIEFMKPIEKGMSKKEFMETLENTIDIQSDKLCKSQ